MSSEYNNIEQEIIDKASSELAADIDRQVLWGLLIDIGWVRVSLTRNYNLEINSWLCKNCKSDYLFHNADFIFESIKDANWFKLRWLEQAQ